MQLLRLWAAAGIFTLAACASAPVGGRAPAAIAFPVIGDIPYSDEDSYVLEEQIVPAVKAGGYPFVIHIGDYKSGGAPCTAEKDDAFAALIEEFAPVPVFYTPGDNEWTDCDRFEDPATGQPQSELARLDIIRTRYFKELVAAPEAMQATAQPDAPENVMWRYKRVRFATVHVVGTGNGRRAVAGDDPAEAGRRADAREAAARNWITAASAAAKTENAKALVIAMHADMTDVDNAVFGEPCAGAAAAREQRCDAFVALRAAVRDAAATFGGPTLLIHGDTAPFTLTQSFGGDEADNLWVLNAAGDHGVTAEGFHYGLQDSTLVEIRPGAAAPFSARGVAEGAPAD
ncbi:hypothetical protein [Hyphococcus luteus]|uniref:Calcineurin-like phosphoesterase domain-containing protein n=1 Tax=Hyphococcus luteus TaxID=2058213 RepID=A0A2S7JZA9_9PROT|nr:hypothetical protein [Marinicaulis flavus]PQA85597.1 hypothetical protein CW354_21920 [Marinicaulis flavus]